MKCRFFEKYRFTFNVRGLLLFLGIMIPNFVWFIVPAPDDILRKESLTQAVDLAGSIFQVLMIAGICLFKNTDNNVKSSGGKILTGFCIACVLGYYVSWVLYYFGVTCPAVTFLLAVLPCLAFILYILLEKIYFVLVPAAGFSVCHVIFALVNFVL